MESCRLQRISKHTTEIIADRGLARTSSAPSGLERYLPLSAVDGLPANDRHLSELPDTPVLL